MGGACGDQNCLSRERPGAAAQNRFRRGGDLQRLRHPADTGFIGFGHLAGIRADEGDAVARQLRDIAFGRGVGPHQRIHRGRDQHRTVGGKQDRGGKIVGVALRHLRHQVGGGGRDDDQIGVAGEADMPGIELALGIEQVGVAALVCERSRSAGDELLRGAGHDAADMDAAILQAADQVERLIGRDAAADDQGDAGLVCRGMDSLRPGG
jgi:hypothetical protein